MRFIKALSLAVTFLAPIALFAAPRLADCGDPDCGTHCPDCPGCPHCPHGK